jgi:sulfur carrier protein ThiS
MKIMYVENQGGGFADYIEIETGMTVGQLLENKGINPASFMVRVDRQQVAMDYVLQEGQRASVTPTKFQGASN